MRRALATLGVLVVLVAGYFIYKFLTTGTLTVTTLDKYSSITISTTANDGRPGKQVVSDAHKSITKALPAGNYIVTVEGSSLGISQTVTIHSLSNQTINLNPSQTNGVEPVDDHAASSLAANNDRLYYTDSNSGDLYSINSQNQIQLLSENSLLKVVWANSSFGVGQDQSNNLWVISHGKEIRLDTPFIANVFTITPNMIYAADSNTAYAAALGGSFNRIYSTKNQISYITAANDYLGIVEVVNSQSSSFLGNIKLVSPAGHTKQQSTTYERIALSPSASALAVFGGEHGGGSIYNQSLSLVTNIPVKDPIGSWKWVDDNNAIFTLADQLWTFNLPSKSAHLVANAPLAGIISNLVLSDDKNYAYFSAAESSETTHIKRVGLKNQKVAPFIFQLANLLPLDSNDCSASFTNFTQPVLNVIPLDVSAPDCTNQVINSLLAAGINPSQVQIRVSP